MKRVLPVVFIILSPLFILSKGFTLKGNVEGLQTATVSLSYMKADGEDTMLTAHIYNGAFTLAGNVPEPELARLAITEGWSYNTSFYLENSDISVQLAKDAPGKTTIGGSKSEMVYEKLKPGLMIFFANARQNEAAHHENAGNSQAVKNADSIWAMQQSEWIQNIRGSISKDEENYAALYFIQWLLFRPGNFDTIQSVFMQLNPAVRKGLAGKKFIADYEHLHRIAPGQRAPEISGKDTSGQLRTLASLKGKVVLLDFWASYCGPCRQENRNMLAVYQKFRTAGFEILSFSLDNERSMWVGALQADGLTWPQVSELRGGASATAGLYEITDLPRNVLIDRTGKIYAKDLHGNELREAIEGLLAKGE